MAGGSNQNANTDHPSLDVLVVDDEEQVLSVIEEFLKQAGHRVRTAKSGRAALDELKKRAADLVITDLRMAEMDGLELALHVREQYPNTRIMMMSGYLPDTSQGGIELKIDDLVKKPFRGASLLSAVDRLAQEVAG
jgi:CheY-like chemotaxis protein